MRTDRLRRHVIAPAAAILLALGLWRGAGAAGAPVSVLPSSFYGVAPQNTLSTADVDRMAQGRVGTLRVLINWSTIDATSADDNDWSAIDPVVFAAAANGISVLPFVFGTPEWVARGLDHHPCRPTTCELFAPRGPAALEQWQRFMREAVERYGPGGEFFAAHPYLPSQPITVWQLWNEQNSATFYRPKPDVKAFATLVRSGTEAVHSADPGAKILLGGMFGSPGGVDEPKLFAWNYLRKLYRIPGIADQFDGVAVHPYAARMSKVIEQVKLMRKEIRRAKDPAEMWITEVGWSSGTGGNPLERGKKGQASRMREAMSWFIGHQAAYNIENVTWFAWRDLAGKPICQWCANAGLFKAGSLSPKPAWKTLMAYTGGS